MDGDDGIDSRGSKNENGEKTVTSLDVENKTDFGVSSWILICSELEEFPSITNKSVATFS